MDLGKAIKELRAKRELSQQDFSQGIGITQSYLSLIEGGKKTPSVDLIKRISEFLTIPVSILFWFTVTEDDVDPKKREIYNELKPTINQLLETIFKTTENE